MALCFASSATSGENIWSKPCLYQSYLKTDQHQFTFKMISFFPRLDTKSMHANKHQCLEKQGYKHIVKLYILSSFKLLICLKIVYTENSQTLFFNSVMFAKPSLFLQVFLQTVLISRNMRVGLLFIQLTVARLLWPASSRLLRNPSMGSGYRSSGLSGLWRWSHHLRL